MSQDSQAALVLKPSHATSELCDLRQVTEPLGTSDIVAVKRGYYTHWMVGRFSEDMCRNAWFKACQVTDLSLYSVEGEEAMATGHMDGRKHPLLELGTETNPFRAAVVGSGLKLTLTCTTDLNRNQSPNTGRALSSPCAQYPACPLPVQLGTRPPAFVCVLPSSEVREC